MALNIRRYDPSGSGRLGGRRFSAHLHPRDYRGRFVRTGGRAEKLYKNTPKRGVGLAGAKKNFTPYARLSTSGTTVGANTGTIIPFTNRRIAIGGYARVEHTEMYGRQKVASGILSSKGLIAGIARRSGLGSAFNSANRSATRQLGKGASDFLAGKRMNVGGAQARFTSSRKFNPTITIRKGRHKASRAASAKGIREYNQHFELKYRNKYKNKTARPGRRKASKKRVR